MKFMKDSALVYAGMKVTRHAKKQKGGSDFLANLGWDAMDKLIRDLQAKNDKKKAEATK